MESPRSFRRVLRSALVVGSVVTVAAAATCFGPNISLADPQATSGVVPTYEWPGPFDSALNNLDKVIPTEKWNPPKEYLPATKKSLILHRAKNNLPQKFTSNVTVKGLSSLTDFHFDLSKKPWDKGFDAPLLAENFGHKSEPKLDFASGHYAYDSNKDIWVDFANHKLGGGVWGHGMVQEEVMALSMPELADAAAMNSYLVRTDSSKMGAYASNPLPLLFENVQRTIYVPDDFYKDGWEKLKLDDFKTVLNQAATYHPPRVANVLAIAVEHLPNKDHSTQYNPDVIIDLFNTFVAGYSLAKETMPGARINTGNIGTGDFNNDPKVVYVLQRLAWRHIGGLDVRYWSVGGIKNDGDTTYQLIIKHWENDKDKTVKNLLLWASTCLNDVNNCNK
jgi:Poly (ADP-ribose) glycohydrolase (PARG)